MDRPDVDEHSAEIQETRDLAWLELQLYATALGFARGNPAASVLSTAPRAP